MVDCLLHSSPERNGSICENGLTIIEIELEIVLLFWSSSYSRTQTVYQQTGLSTEKKTSGNRFFRHTHTHTRVHTNGNSKSYAQRHCVSDSKASFTAPAKTTNKQQFSRSQLENITLTKYTYCRKYTLHQNKLQNKTSQDVANKQWYN